MTAEIILKINQEIEYYFWLRKEVQADQGRSCSDS